MYAKKSQKKGRKAKNTKIASNPILYTTPINQANAKRTLTRSISSDELPNKAKGRKDIWDVIDEHAHEVKKLQAKTYY